MNENQVDQVETLIQTKKAYLAHAQQAREDYRYYVSKAGLIEKQLKSIQEGSLGKYQEPERGYDFVESFY